MNSNIFVTDANYKHSLGIIRSLGSKSLNVSCGSTYFNHLPISFYSNYVKSTFFYPNPQKYPEKFCSYLKKIMIKNNIDILIPVGYEVFSAISNNIKMFEEYNLPITNIEAFQIAASKSATISLANSLGIPGPQTIEIDSIEDLKKIKMDFPLVVKGIFGAGFVKYAYNFNELEYYVKKIHDLQGVFPIVQEYISGDGYGFFGLFNKGSPRAYFMHKRLREYPITGGPSTCAQSIYDKQLLSYGLKILQKLNWNGVAMVEFKKDNKNGDYKIMEINPKFWGSLDLAIASGVDFPYLLYEMILNGDIKPHFSYKVGLKYMWPFPDDFNRVISNPLNFKSFIFDLFNYSVNKNIEYSDIDPNLMQLNLTIYNLIKKLV